jgi:alpha-1,3-rhamnosyl/mannosyltransferase
MRIGIDARAASEVTAGRGRYVRELLQGISRLHTEHTFLLFARTKWREIELGERTEWRLLEARDPLWHIKAARAANRECDVFLSTNSYLTAWFLRKPSVIVVFDMVAFDPKLRPQRRASLIERVTLRPAVRRAEALVAISESTKRDLVAKYPFASAKARVVPLAAGESFTPDDTGRRAFDTTSPGRDLGGRYVLALGTLEPRKNLPRLIEAFVGLPDALLAEYELVLAGDVGWDTGETLATAAEHAEHVRRIGKVADEDLPALYRGAELFCYPSLYEGFGLPVLEAMQSGTPVITSNVSSMPEVAGDAACYVDPLDVTDLRRAMRELLTDRGRREDLARRGPEQAANFSWMRTARETLEVLERATGG